MSTRMCLCRSLLFCSCCFVLLGTIAGIAADDAQPEGRELFVHQWRQDDPRSHSGDGLGPVYNDVSCAACHVQGGVGGAGPAEKNVQVGSVFGSGAIVGGASEQQREALESLHPGFLKARSVVLHRLSTDADYEDFRKKNFTHRRGLATSDLFGLLSGGGSSSPLTGVTAASRITGQVLTEVSAKLPTFTKEQAAELSDLRHGVRRPVARHDFREVVLLVSERNTPALFGDGLIDTIPDRALLAAAERKHEDYPEVSGRVAKSKDGKIGRFGWKAQQARLDEFVLAACAMEVGLEVPGKSQGILPYKADYKAPGFDLTASDCRELTKFVSLLSRPRQLSPKDADSKAKQSEGSRLFTATGCAACHVPDLGDVSGIYSDLVLHDMGPLLSDPAAAGAYGGSQNDDTQFPLPPLAGGIELPIGVSPGNSALAEEWRTPPLWGLHDSAPYLHDGRAETIEQAIALHDGEAKRSMRQFFKLPADERQELVAFLNSLVAPETKSE